jgi:hypothetical protein
LFLPKLASSRCFKNLSILFSYRKHSIEFELKNFDKEFNQNKETAALLRSPALKIGEFDWALGPCIRKHPILERRAFLSSLFCNFRNVNLLIKVNFQLTPTVKFCILNQEKDSRKTHSKGMIES